MSPEEVFNAITINAAYALRLQEECGSLSVGKRADFLVMKSNQSLAKMPYYMGENQVDRIFIKGEEWV
jgi:imidazolonepropionase